MDFLTLIDGKIVDLVEVKLSDQSLSKNLVYFNKILRPLKPVQVVMNLNRTLEVAGVPIRSASERLQEQIQKGSTTKSVFDPRRKSPKNRLRCLSSRF